MNPISLTVYHSALYTVGTIGGWLSANPVLCIGIVYGFMGTQSLHLVHVLAARAFYSHGNLLGGCVHWVHVAWTGSARYYRILGVGSTFSYSLAL